MLGEGSIVKRLEVLEEACSLTSEGSPSMPRWTLQNYKTFSPKFKFGERNLLNKVKNDTDMICSKLCADEVGACCRS